MSGVDAAAIWRLDVQLSTQLLRAAAPAIEQLGLEAKAFFVLDGVEASPYPAALADYLSMPRPTMTQHLKKLEAQGLIVRALDPQDLRRHRLQLTPSGMDTRDRARAILAQVYRERLDQLSRRELDAFAALLGKLVD